MRCKNDFKNDRLCDICKFINSEEYGECKNHYEEKQKTYEQLAEIEENCPYRKMAWDEYQSYCQCTRPRLKGEKYKEECNVGFECEKYIK